jgi:aspartate carbamoyltransferase catalytic subunit
MSCHHSMDADHAVAVRVPTRHAKFLRESLDACRDSLLADLATPDQLRDPQRARHEADAYGRLLKSLDTCVIVPDADVLYVLRALADSVDNANDFTRVVFEHRAFCGLLGQIEGGER